MDIKIMNQDKIIEHYGVASQLGIATEECAELIQAISKISRKCRGYISAEELVEERKHLIEEIADVMVCIEQLKEILYIPDEDIQSVCIDKTMRQMSRIKEAEIDE